MSTLTPDDMCGDGCPKCLTFTTPSGSKVYKCMEDDAGATIIVAVCITVATLVCVILIVLLVVKLRKKDNFAEKKSKINQHKQDDGIVGVGGKTILGIAPLNLNLSKDKLEEKGWNFNFTENNGGNILSEISDIPSQTPYNWEKNLKNNNKNLVNLVIDYGKEEEVSGDFGKSINRITNTNPNNHGNGMDNSHSEMLDQKEISSVPKIANHIIPLPSKNRKSENCASNEGTNFSLNIGSITRKDIPTHTLNNTNKHQDEISHLHLRKSSRRKSRKSSASKSRYLTPSGAKIESGNKTPFNLEKIEEHYNDEEKIRNLMKLKSRKKTEIRESFIKMHRNDNKEYEHDEHVEKIKKMQTSKSKKSKRKKMDLKDGTGNNLKGFL